MTAKNETPIAPIAPDKSGKGRPAKTFVDTTDNHVLTVKNVITALQTIKPDIKVWNHPSNHTAFDVVYSLTIDNVDYSGKLYLTPDVSEETQREKIANLTEQNNRMARSMRYVGCAQTIAFAQFANGRIGYIVGADGSKTADYMQVEALRASLCAKGVNAKGDPDDCLSPIVIGDWVYTYSRTEILGFTVTPVVK